MLNTRRQCQSAGLQSTARLAVRRCTRLWPHLVLVYVVRYHVCRAASDRWSEHLDWEVLGTAHKEILPISRRYLETPREEQRASNPYACQATTVKNLAACLSDTPPACVVTDGKKHLLFQFNFCAYVSYFLSLRFSSTRLSHMNIHFSEYQSAALKCQR